MQNQSSTISTPSRRNAAKAVAVRPVDVVVSSLVSVTPGFVVVGLVVGLLDVVIISPISLLIIGILTLIIISLIING